MALPKKNRPAGNAAKKIVMHSNIVEFLLMSGQMYLHYFIFSIFGIVFIMDQIPSWLKIIIGIVFLAPVIILQFSSGMSTGEKEYKYKKQNEFADIHSEHVVQVPIAKSLLYVTPFAALSMLLIVLSVLIQNLILRGILTFLFMPVTLVFLGAGVFGFETVTWLSVLIVGLAVLLSCAAFVFGYARQVLILRRQSSEIVSELRNFGA